MAPFQTCVRREEDLNVIFYQNMLNLHNRYKSAERKISSPLFSIFSLVAILVGSRDEISSNGQNCSILSQNVPKFELYKYNDELFNIYITGFFMNFELLSKCCSY
jgi:hypothetical protein